MSKVCTACNGTGHISNELKRSVKLKGKELHDLRYYLTDYVDYIVIDPENAKHVRKVNKILDRLYKPVKGGDIHGQNKS